MQRAEAAQTVQSNDTLTEAIVCMYCICISNGYLWLKTDVCFSMHLCASRVGHLNLTIGSCSMCGYMWRPVDRPVGLSSLCKNWPAAVVYNLLSVQSQSCALLLLSVTFFLCEWGSQSHGLTSWSGCALWCSSFFFKCTILNTFITGQFQFLPGCNVFKELCGATLWPECPHGHFRVCAVQ